MADYKEIIAGTIKNLADKVKDAAETSGVREKCVQGLERTKGYGEIAKLTIEINGEKEALKRTYQEIGRLYFEENQENPGETFAALFSQAQTQIDGIQSRHSRIEALKTGASETGNDIEVEVGEFEEVVNSTEADGKGEEKVEIKVEVKTEEKSEEKTEEK